MDFDVAAAVFLIEFEPRDGGLSSPAGRESNHRALGSVVATVARSCEGRRRVVGVHSRTVDESADAERMPILTERCSRHAGGRSALPRCCCARGAVRRKRSSANP